MTFELSPIERVIERNKIVDVIVGIANAIDKKDWRKLRSYLADEISIDYSEFRGEPPQQITAEAYVQQRVESLTHLKTLHISTNHEVTVSKGHAQCRSAYRIYRFDPTCELGQDRLDTAGNYDHQLIQVEEDWQVTAIKQTVVMIDGNRQVHRGLNGR
jgi:SnoaL-like domain